MSDQLALDVAAPPAYTCCGQPCPTLQQRPTAATPFPHAPDCDNSAVVAGWIHRETGQTVRLLHCIKADGTCPSGGTFRAREGLHDPHGGACCLTLRKRATTA